MAEAITHEHDKQFARRFTILYASFDQKSGRILPHRIPALPNGRE
jgi:hypothetical protein